MNLQRVDHLIFGAASLEVGVATIRELLGVEPDAGGRQPAFGTCNALLSLGTETYLEIMAPDPELPAPEQGRLFDLAALEKPRMITWVLRSYAIEEDVARANAAAVPLGAVSGGSRTNPDGSELRWRMSDPYAFPMEGPLPFLLDWGNSQHPGGMTPTAGSLSGLVLRHPDTDALRNALDGMGLSVPVAAGPAGLTATIETDRGPVTLS
jgi:hypothetical protein